LRRRGAITRTLAAEGAKLAVADINREAVDGTVDDIVIARGSTLSFCYALARGCYGQTLPSTTSLNHRSDEIIEVGAIAFTFDPSGTIGEFGRDVEDERHGAAASRCGERRYSGHHRADWCGSALEPVPQLALTSSS
jgi:hypothetical protein